MVNGGCWTLVSVRHGPTALQYFLPRLGTPGLAKQVWITWDWIRKTLDSATDGRRLSLSLPRASVSSLTESSWLTADHGLRQYCHRWNPLPADWIYGSSDIAGDCVRRRRWNGAVEGNDALYCTVGRWKAIISGGELVGATVVRPVSACSSSASRQTRCTAPRQGLPKSSAEDTKNTW